MPARSRYGDGAKPRQRADGYWVASVEAGYTERGTRRRRSVVAKTEAECKRRIRDLKREILAGQAVSVDPRMTVKRYADVWLEDYKRHARPRTQVTTSGYVTKWIVPAMGNRKLSDLGVGDIRTLERNMEDAGRSSTTIVNVRRVLHTMLKAAIREGYSVPDPVMVARKPREATSTRRAMSVDEAGQLLRAAGMRAQWPPLPADAGDAMVTARRLALEVDASRWVAALLQGMRQGECLGLTWECVDLDAGTLDVSWQLQHIPATTKIPADYEVRPIVGKYALVRPKSKAGRRVIPLVPLMAGALADWKDRCPPTPEGLVWPRLTGKPTRAADDRAAWYGLQQAAGVRKGGTDEKPEFYLVHEARHTTLTILSALGVQPEVSIAIVGHASLASSETYKHSDLSRAREALSGVAARLGFPELEAAPRDS